MKTEYKFIYCNYNKNINIFLYINVADKCYKLMIIFKTILKFQALQLK